MVDYLKITDKIKKKGEELGWKIDFIYVEDKFSHLVIEKPREGREPVKITYYRRENLPEALKFIMSYAPDPEPEKPKPKQTFPPIGSTIKRKGRKKDKGQEKLF